MTSRWITWTASMAVSIAAMTAWASAQDSSSWSSGTLTAPNQKPGEAKLLKSAPGRKDLRPTIGPEGQPSRIIPQSTDSDPKSSFTPLASGQDGQRGTGMLATTTVAKSNAGTDPAYDAFDQGRYLTAIDLASKASEAGDPQAPTLMGRIYQEGLGVKQDSVKAAQWYRRAAERGDLEGTFAFAVMLAEGDGIQKNRAGAAELFDAAAQRGHVLANYNLALLFLKGDGKPESPSRAALHLKYAAEQGVAAAQYDLASLYATGTGVPPSAFEAATWLERAATQGHPEAELDFGVWLFQGRGIPVSQSRGALFLKSAAGKGVPVAQNCLARCYAFGAGVPLDLIEAAKWHTLARAGGVDDKGLDDVVKKLKPAERLLAQKAAEDWREAQLVR